MRFLAQVAIAGTWIDILEGRYLPNNRIALVAYERATGDKFATITINIPEVHLAEDEFLIANEQMTERIFRTLLEIPTWEPTHKTAVGDRYCGPIMRLRRFNFDTQ